MNFALWNVFLGGKDMYVADFQQEMEIIKINM